jgi:hypothetical protein
LDPNLTPQQLAALFDRIGHVARNEAAQGIKPDALSLADKEQLELDRGREKLSQLRRINRERLIVVRALFVLTVLWLASVIAVTILAGLGPWGFYLSDKVVMTYIVSTTVSVLGLFKIAADWLFSQKGDE